MPDCAFGAHAPAVWRCVLLVRVVGTEDPILYPDRYVCNIHRKTLENVAQAAPQATRALIGDRLERGGYPPPRWDTCSVGFEKL